MNTESKVFMMILNFSSLTYFGLSLLCVLAWVLMPRQQGSSIINLRMMLVVFFVADMWVLKTPGLLLELRHENSSDYPWRRVMAMRRKKGNRRLEKKKKYVADSWVR